MQLYEIFMRSQHLGVHPNNNIEFLSNPEILLEHDLVFKVKYK